mgnify:CR=1 FL=1
MQSSDHPNLYVGRNRNHSLLQGSLALIHYDEIINQTVLKLEKAFSKYFMGLPSIVSVLREMETISFTGSTFSLRWSMFINNFRIRCKCNQPLRKVVQWIAERMMWRTFSYCNVPIAPSVNNTISITDYGSPVIRSQWFRFIIWEHHSILYIILDLFCFWFDTNHYTCKPTTM